MGQIGRYEVLNPLENMQRKRRRSREDTKISAKRNTGAGDTIDPADASIGVGQHIWKSQGGDAKDQQSIDMEEVHVPDSDTDSGLKLQQSALALLRRKERLGSPNGPPDGDGRAVVDAMDQNSTSEQYSEKREPISDDSPGSWHTFQYRSIFGIVPIGQSHPSAGGETTEARRNLEIAIVELPMRDVDYGPRFDGGQDWKS
jgi:hypothetical protein